MDSRLVVSPPLPGWLERFGIRGLDQLQRDLGAVLRDAPSGRRFSFNLASAALLRPRLSLAAYAGRLPPDGVAPIFNFFDRSGGGRDFRYTVRRSAGLRDFRGGRLSYDEHDGTDFVCPPGTPLVAAAPGVVVATRDTWIRGGLTLCVDHGDGVVTQYTHLTRITAALGARVERGEEVAQSGTSGLDMTQFFPWVPPHVHFMVWLHGRPVDPYRAPGESGPGGWLHGNDPETTAGALPDDPSPSTIETPVDERALDVAIKRCRSEAVLAELHRAPTAAARVAVLEDSLHHDRAEWPPELQGLTLRPPGQPERVRLTLPLSARYYRRAAPADTRLTRPRG